MSFFQGSRVALVATSLLWGACDPAANPELVKTGVYLSIPSVTITRMDNVQHVLEGSLRSRRAIAWVEVYEDTRLLGYAQVDADGVNWRFDWKPDDAAKSLLVRAYDVDGQAGSAALNLQHVQFATEPGLYHSEVFLRLPVSSAAQTRYTLDGSTPTVNSPLAEGPLVLLPRQGEPTPLSFIETNPFDAPLHWRWRSPKMDTLPHATVVRIQQFVGSLPVGPSETRTYLVGGRASALPVASLATDAGNFFDFDRGIYVPGRMNAEDPSWPWYWGTGNYMEDGKEWERPIHVEWFEPAGQRLLAQNAGVRIHGSGSSALPQKSLRLYAKEDYGPETFKPALFPDSSLRDYKRLILRTSGQDSLASKLKDCALQSALVGLGLDLQACRPAVVFLNGEYWGLHELRERYDEYYLAQHHGLDRKKIVVLEGLGAVNVGTDGDETPYLQLLDYVRQNDLSVAEHYAYVKARMDVDNFTDYVIAQVFLGNEDWPHNNAKWWRFTGKNPGGTSTDGDGRWRWLLYDLDLAFVSGPDANSLARLLTGDELPEPSVALVRALLQSPEFKARFIERFRWHLDHTFTEERMTAHVDALEALIAPEMPAHINRWGYPLSLEDWSADVASLRTALEQRPAFMRQFLEEAFGPL
ncbi:CotH kinase family protein [Archangium primigenium]|uniref:CotH kinase family protein n=1 Tax=[Archangium] primigenium TaxID=2792470 RepID=UPI00195EBE41|nr:CotH kinase family protein [Archangium primigenium]MBM7113841.1 CotH kinase family protein [Archangium primigenium]